jgi:hypothetical protein
MKTIVKVIAAIAVMGGGFFAYQTVNAADITGNAGVSYSDTRTFRGVKQADDTLGVNVGLATSLAEKVSLGLSLDSFNALESAQTNELRTGIVLGYDVCETASVSLGYTNYDYQSATSNSEIGLGVSVETLLNPSLLYATDSDNDSDVTEISVGHSLSLSEQFGLTLGGSLGSVDAAADYTYYSVGATVTTSVGGADTFAGVALVDNDNAGSDSETVFSVGLSLKF